MPKLGLDFVESDWQLVFVSECYVQFHVLMPKCKCRVEVYKVSAKCGFEMSHLFMCLLVTSPYNCHSVNFRLTILQE